MNDTPSTIAQYSKCTETLRALGKPYPRTCAECGLGPCKIRPKAITKSPIEIEIDTLRARIAELEAAAVPVQAIPGWQWVPKKLTPDMEYEVQENAHILPPRAKRIWDMLLNAAPTPPIQSQVAESDESAADYETIMGMGRLLEKIAIAVKGEEKAKKRHGYADLPELVEKMAIELEVYRAAPSLQSEPPQPTDDGVKEGSWAHLRLMMEHSAWDGKLELSDALANITDFAATQPTQDSDSRDAARYRLIRSELSFDKAQAVVKGKVKKGLMAWWPGIGLIISYKPELVDEAIDAAIEETRSRTAKKKKGGTA